MKFQKVYCGREQQQQQQDYYHAGRKKGGKKKSVILRNMWSKTSRGGLNMKPNNSRMVNIAGKHRLMSRGSLTLEETMRLSG